MRHSLLTFEERHYLSRGTIEKETYFRSKRDPYFEERHYLLTFEECLPQIRASLRALRWMSRNW